jgi:asparagine synthase (glutamine-hydrolysing)
LRNVWYLALIWNPADPAQCVVARRLSASLQQGQTALQPSIDSNGLILFCSIDCATPTDKRCVVLGTLFRQNQVATLDSTAIETIVHSKGRQLISDYWGSYVAFIHDEQSQSTYVLRDPSGVIPCYCGLITMYTCTSSATKTSAKSLPERSPSIESICRAA